MARRGALRRPPRAQPGAPRSGQQPARDRDRHASGRTARRHRRLAGVHPPVGDHPRRICAADRIRGPHRRGLGARAQAGGGRGRRPGSARHVADARARRGALDRGRDRGHRRAGRRLAGRPGGDHRRGCAGRLRPPARYRPAARRPPARRATHRSALGDGVPRCVRRAARRPAAAAGCGREPGDRAVRGVLPGRLAGVRRWPRRAAAAERDRGPERLGQRGPLSRRVRRRTGGSRAACSRSRASSAHR